MFYHFALMAATCMALAACSGSDDKPTSATKEPIPTVATETTKPAEMQSTPAVEAQPVIEAVSSNPAADPTTCPYSVDELNQALGLSLSIVNAVEVPFAGGIQLSCLYTGEQPATVTVNKLAMQDPKMLEGMEQYLAGSLEPIANDPDQAQWQTSEGGLNDLTLHYVRAGTSIDIRLMGVDQADWEAIKSKIVDLRRIP